MEKILGPSQSSWPTVHLQEISRPKCLPDPKVTHCARLRNLEDQRRKERNWKSCAASHSNSIQFKEMTYHNIVSLFWLLALGVFLALCALVLELAWSDLKSSCKIKKSHSEKTKVAKVKAARLHRQSFEASTRQTARNQATNDVIVTPKILLVNFSTQTKYVTEYTVL